jgi:hypothetical protein
MSCFTDYLDGYLARYDYPVFLYHLVESYIARLWKQQSAFGAFLDPVADKVQSPDYFSSFII